MCIFLYFSSNNNSLNYKIITMKNKCLYCFQLYHQCQLVYLNSSPRRNLKHFVEIAEWIILLMSFLFVSHLYFSSNSMFGLGNESLWTEISYSWLISSKVRHDLFSLISLYFSRINHPPSSLLSSKWMCANSNVIEN